MFRSTDDLRQALELIHPSLLPLLVREQDIASLSNARVRIRKLPQVAVNICKLSSLIVQAYWCFTRLHEIEAAVSDELDDILKHIWKGLQKHDAGLAVSILTKAATTSPASSELSQFIGKTDVIHKWNRLFTSRTYAYRNYTKELRTEDWPELFWRLVRELKVLHTTRYEEGNFVFRNGAISEFPFVRKASINDGVLYLYSFERLDSTPRLIYESPFHNNAVAVHVHEDPGMQKYYNVLRKRLGFDDLTEGIIHLFGNGYLHLQNLASAIAFARGGHAQQVYEELERRYSKNTNWFGDIDVKRRKADFIVMLLAAQGPSRVLKEILADVRFRVFDDYLMYLEPLVEGNREEWTKMLQEQISLRENQLAGYLSIDEEKQREISNDIDLETRCWCLLKAAGFAIETPQPYVESIDMRIDLIRNWRQQFRNGDLSLETVALKIEKLVERTFKFLICFYSGLQGYLKAKQRDRSDRKDFERAMLTEAKKTIERIWKIPPGILLDRLHARLEELNKKNEITQFAQLAEATDHDEEGLAYPLLGRKQVCNMELFQDLASKEYINVFNRIKHDLLYDQEGRVQVTPSDMLKFLDHSIRLFDFLRTGNDDPGSREGYSLEPIYPMVISFQEEHRNRDELIIYDYEIYCLNRMRAPKIRILTPHEYEPNENYYCIPFYNRSTTKWWLDPFLIRCNQFESVLLNSAEVETILAKDQYL